MASNKKALFWTSYADLMTSMFFAMLVLFVVFVVAMGSANRRIQELLNKSEVENDSIKASNTQLQQIIKLNEQFETLTKSSSLNYDADKKMFYAKDLVGIEIFEPNDDDIKYEHLATVDKVGRDIKKLISSLKEKNSDIKYMLVIEGTAAIPYEQLRAGTYNSDNQGMYLLSYRRALALYNRWKDLGFRDGTTEIIIAGSGFNGINRDERIEDNNKRFVIQIIPKVGKPEN
jgi:biopolymer transport protein ExbD